MFDRPRPNAQLGVFETLLVVDGRPVELAAHLARLSASLRELFGADPPSDLDEEIRERANDIGRGSLRLTATPEPECGIRTEIVVRQLDPCGDFPPIYTGKSPHPAIDLQTLTLPDGLGAHKWADRSLLDATQARLPTGALPLIADRGGAVLEASRANVFAVRRGALFTPPLDGRILPGITRARVLTLAAASGIEAHEAPLSREDLLAADEVFLTGSLRGAEPAVSLDDTPLGNRRAVSTALGTELHRAWAGEGTAAAFG